MTDTRKDDFIEDYVDEALQDPTERREDDQLYDDALIEWESSEIDKATERYKQRDM